MTDDMSLSRVDLDPISDMPENDEDHTHDDHTSAAQLLLPRLRIDAFVSEDILTIEHLQSDRRARRAQIELFDSGLEAAIARYASKQAPDIILVEQQCASKDVVALVDKLAEHCPPTTRLILLGDCNDVTLYRDLVKAGVSDYLLRPVKVAALLDTLLDVVEDDGATDRLGKVVAFLGVRGGIGTSMLSQNIADAINYTYDAATILVDTDIGFGTAAMQFNIEPPYSLGDALKEQENLTPDVLDKHVFWYETRFGVLSAPLSLDQITPPAQGCMRHVIDQARRLAKFVIVDMPTGVAPWSAEIFEIADEVCLVVGNDLPSLRNARTFIQMLQKARPNDRPVRLIVNRLPQAGGPVPASEFKRILGVEVEIEFAETDLARKVDLAGGVLRRENPKAAIVQQVNQLAAKLGDFDAPEQPQSKSIFARFQRKS